MARLLVFRGESVDREMELGPDPVRIGRDRGNDLVLEDPGKAISRVHAELRYEGDRYVIVDLESQNGVWIDGQRVRRAVLQPNVAATLGPFRLMVDQSADPAVAPHADDRTSYPEPSGVYGPEATDDEDWSQPPPLDSRPAASPSRRTEWLRRQPKAVWLGTAAVVLVTGFGVTRMIGGPPLQESQAQIIERHLTQARETIDRGESAAAITELDIVLGLDPTNKEAQDLKNEELAKIQPVPPAPGPRPTVDLPVIEGPEPPPPPPGPDTGNLKPKKPVNVDLPPEQGGLKRLTGETDTNLQSREARMREDLEGARKLLLSALGVEDCQRLVKELERIINEAGPDYLDARRLLARAQQRLEAVKIWNGAKEHENNGRWDDAIAEYKRAQEMDSALDIDGHIDRVKKRKQTEGEQKLKEADSAFIFFNYGPAYALKALGLYEEAKKLLPPEHKDYDRIIKRIAELKR